MLEGVLSILVIDDESDIVNPIKRFLQKQGFKPYGFTDPFIAFEYFKNNSNSIDPILRDIGMPQMNGYELIRRIKTLQPKVRVILISAFEINELEFSKVLPSVKIDGEGKEFLIVDTNDLYADTKTLYKIRRLTGMRLVQMGTHNGSIQLAGFFAQILPHEDSRFNCKVM